MHFRMLLYLVACFFRVTVSLLCRLQQAVSTYMYQFIPILLVKGYEIVRPCDRHSNETVTLRTHVIKYKHIQKWIVRNIKIAQVSSIRITTSINLL